MPRREKPRLSLRRPPRSDSPLSPGQPSGTVDPVEAFVEGTAPAPRCSPLTVSLSDELIRRLHQACTTEAVALDTAVAEALAAWVEAEPPARYDW